MENKKSSVPKLRFPGFTGAWEQQKLGEVVNFLDTLRKPLEGAKRVKGPYPYYGASGIVDYVDGYLFDEELILLSEDGANITERNYPVCFLASGKYWVNNHAHVLKIKEDNDNNFICNSLERKDYTKYNTGMAMPKLNKETCKGIPIMCPNYDEQKKIGNYFRKFDTLIALHQRKLEHLKEQKKGLLQKMFPKNGEVVPEVRFPGFADDWEQRKLGEEFKKVNERNNGEFGKDRWISVAKMYFQDPDKVTSNNIDTRTYVMRLGDIAFEGHPNNEFKFGRFVANDIGDGVVSELFPIYRHIRDYDNNYWKYAIHLERIMGPIFAKSITSSGNSSNKLAPKDLLRQSIFLPHLDEQKQIGYFFKQFDSLIALHQRKLEHLKLMKKGLLQQMFV